MKDVTPGNKSKEIATLNVTQSELAIKDIKGQVTKIQAIMKSVMRDDVHFGNVPGIKNKILYKSGAEKLCLTFRLIPEYTIEKTPMDNGHVTYDVKCILFHGPSGAKMGEGVGACSTMEKKYRYRNDNISTGVEVPKAWWQSRDNDKLELILKNNGVTPKTAAALAKEGLTISTAKIGKKFFICYQRKIDNPDIADLYNTVLKMAKKRAFVDATITALSVGDMFTQDMQTLKEDDDDADDEIEEEEDEEEKKEEEKKPRTTARGRTSKATTVAPQKSRKRSS